MTPQDTLWQKLLRVVPVERFVAFILAPLLMVVVPWFIKLMATWYPGVHLDPQQVSNLMVTTVAGVILLTLKWLHGRQIPESRPWKSIPVVALGKVTNADVPPAASDPPIPLADMPPPGTMERNLDAPATGSTPGAPA